MINTKNKIVMLPMDTKMSRDGFVNDFHIQHYGARIWGGVGTIIMESVAVSPEGRIEFDDLGLWSDDHIEGYKHITKMAKIQNTRIGLQLNHAGSDAIDTSSKVKISTKYRPNEQEIPLASIEKIEKVIEDFISAAKRAEKAGMDFIEIHAAHGYFWSEFISPITNEINPSTNILERSKYLISFVKKLKEEISIPFGIRLSVDDYFPEGNTAKDFEPLIKALENDVLYFNVSTWIISTSPLFSKKVKKTKLYRLEDALVIKSFTKKPILASGNFNSRKDIDLALEKGIDFVGLGKELLYNPNFVINEYFTIDELKKMNFEYIKGNRFYNHIKYKETKK